ncbi:MAG: type II toxin-antitoxin system RelE/ParE family toxin [Rhodospirillaceae bacterium]|nr:type II toxin-antitoxin system RelE/ParE family toxin [Rhodospirillaceae bacterium]
MARRLTIAEAALADLEAARTWLTQDGAGDKARQRLVAIREAILALRDTPRMWPVKDHPGIRQRAVAGYSIAYRLTPDTGTDRTSGDVEIIRVFGPYQDRSEI